MWPFGCRQKCDEQVTDKTVLPSATEEFQKAGVWVTSFHGPPGSMTRKTVVFTIRCNTCGKIRVHREFSA